MSVILNLTVDQGTTFEKTFTIYETDTSVLNLTNYQIRAELRKVYAAITSVPFTIVCASPATGQVTISLTDTQTSALTPGRDVYDVELKDSSNKVSRALEGKITVTPEVTRTSTGIQL